MGDWEWVGREEGRRHGPANLLADAGHLHLLHLLPHTHTHNGRNRERGQYRKEKKQNMTVVVKPPFSKTTKDVTGGSKSRSSKRYHLDARCWALE